MNILQSIGSFITAAAIAVSGFFGGFIAPTPQPVPEPTLGAALPAATAVFETSLAAPITSSATTLTLTANSVRGGGSVSGYTCLTIDEGSAQAETVCGTLSGTTMSGMSRGISQSTGTTTVAALQFAHRRGANVKITDFPVIQIVKAQNNGEDTFPNQLIYAAGVTPTNTSALTDKEYVDGLAFSGAGVIDATSIAKGVSELATGAEAAASTAMGGSGPLVLPASVATSTYNSATAANVVPVTGGTGILDPKFIFNGQSLTFPSSTGGATTTLSNNGSGALSWTPFPYLISAGGGSTFTGPTASTTIISATIPANTLTAGKAVRVTVPIVTGNMVNSSAEWMFSASLGGTATTTLNLDARAGGLVSSGSMEFYLIGNTSSSQFLSGSLTATSSNANLFEGSRSRFIGTSTPAVDSTLNQTLLIQASTTDVAGSSNFSFFNYLVEALK